MKVKDLKPAEWNPRTITDKKLEMMKKCLICNNYFPATIKYFSPHSRYKNSLYLRGYCRKCDVSKSAAWRRANPERARIKMRECTRRWRDLHREEVKRRYRERRNNNLELAHKKEAIKRKANPDVYRRASRLFRDRHPVQTKAATQAWQKRNLEYCRLKAKDRRDRLRSNGGGITVPEWLGIVASHSSCPLCGMKWTEDLRPTVDHIIPISRGGKHDKNNIQPLCLSCNIRKGNRDVREKINSCIS